MLGFNIVRTVTDKFFYSDLNDAFSRTAIVAERNRGKP